MDLVRECCYTYKEGYTSRLNMSTVRASMGEEHLSAEHFGGITYTRHFLSPPSGGEEYSPTG